MSDQRSSKSQRELLNFVDNFIHEHGYGPSYREIMRSLGYKSVSTVAKHIDNLVVLGCIVKREGEARSLEVIYEGQDSAPKWSELELEIASRESAGTSSAAQEAEILRQALAILRK